MSNEIEFDENSGHIASEEEVDAFLEKYKDDLEEVEKELHQEFESSKPEHPITKEFGSFVGYVYKYPLYRTQSGEEFILKKGEPNIVKRLY